MFLSRNKKNNVYPCKPQFYYIKVEFKGSILYRHDFVMDGFDRVFSRVLKLSSCDLCMKLVSWYILYREASMRYVSHREVTVSLQFYPSFSQPLVVRSERNVNENPVEYPKEI